MVKVSVEKTPAYDLAQMCQVVEKHFACFQLENRLSPASRVAVKPNLLMKRTPDQATTTHPVLVEAVILTLQKLGVSRITLIDSPGGLYNRQALEGIYQASGLADVARRTGVALNDDFTFQRVAFPQGEQCREFSLLTPLTQADFIINLPKLKTHGMTAISGGVKNLFGCIPGLQKPELHFRFPKTREFCNMLVDLSLAVAPGFTITDGVWAMEGDGPSGGTPKYLGITLASDQIYALDYVQSVVMGLDPMKVPTVACSVDRGLCPTFLEEISIVGDGFEVCPDFRLPKTKTIDFLDHLPGFLRRPAAFLCEEVLAPRPVVRQRDCIGCGRCAQSCPTQIIRIEKGKAHIPADGCIRCFCCHEMCPVKAISIRRFSVFDR